MNFCSYFDRAHLTRGVLMARSLLQHCPGVELTLLCFDDTVTRVLRDLFGDRIKLMPLEELEQADSALLEAKKDRSFREYLSTVRPSLMLELLKGQPRGSALHYVDADMFFFSDPTPLEAEFEQADVLITPHDFATHCLYLSDRGDFNAGWISAKNSPGGREALGWWRLRCLEWCKIAIDGERFANQGYLNGMLANFPQVRAMHHRGVNVGPWNAGTRELGYDGTRFTAGPGPLVAYHFSTISRLAPGCYFTDLAPYGLAPRGLLHSIYRQYLDRFERFHRSHRHLPGLEWPPDFRRRARRTLELLVKLWRSDYVLAFGRTAP